MKGHVENAQENGDYPVPPYSRALQLSISLLNRGDTLFYRRHSRGGLQEDGVPSKGFVEYRCVDARDRGVARQVRLWQCK